jgi:peptidoglycan hydrolase-like protein with peptidoglycan-binding domain
MDTYLSSETAREGDRFTATVSRDVEVEGRVAVAADSKVEGRVTAAERADRKSKAGTLAVSFDRLVLDTGQSIAIDGTLTTLDDEARRKLEGSEEGRVEGDSQKRRAVVFIGGGAGAGAVIGAVAGGGKGAAVGAGIGAVLGTIGTLLSKGDEAEVKPGTEFGMMVERAFTVEGGRIERPRPGGAQGATSTESIRAAQMMLRDLGHYEGPLDGRLSYATRNAIRQFQRDRRLSVTGELDDRTGRELGVLSQSGDETVLVSISTSRAEWEGRDSVRISLEAQAEGPGWQVYTDHFVASNTLHVYVRGVPPRRPGRTRQRYPVDETYRNISGVSRVVFHGADRDVTVELGGGSAAAGSTGNARQILALADRLLTDYRRSLSGRGVGPMVLDSRRDYQPGELDLLSQLMSLQSAADLYNQVVGRLTDNDALTGAADGLLRQARQVNRVLRRSAGLSLPRAVQDDWQQLGDELKRITITDSNLDTDIERIR